VTRVQVLLMCQLRHPNIISAEDIYLPSDIPVGHRDNGMRLQRSNTDHICVRMPYYPADMAWLIHSSPQVLTPEHVQVTLWPCRGSNCSFARGCHAVLVVDALLQYIFVQILRGLRYSPRCCVFLERFFNSRVTFPPDTCTLPASFTVI
jgi:hypothetical protein